MSVVPWPRPLVEELGGTKVHHKRKRPRNQRAGCKMCKPWKVNGTDQYSEIFESHSSHKRRVNAREEMAEYKEDGSGKERVAGEPKSSQAD